MDNIKVAIVCDSLDQYGGAEKIVEAFHEMFPNAPIYTSFYDRERMMKHGFVEKGKQIITPRFGKNKILLKIAKHLFFIYPLIFERYDFSRYDLVLSSSSRFAHGVVTNSDTTHICYMHSPSRYAWDYFVYMKSIKTNFFFKLFIPFIVSYLRVWDRVASDRVDYFIANSKYTQKRIRKFYRRESVVINPYVDTKRFQDIKTEKGKYYLFLGRFVPIRRLDIMINCFNKSGLPLRIVGNGDLKYTQQLKSISKSNIEFFEKQTDEQVVNHLAGSTALVWTGLEDFGIAPIEAQAAATPVIAYRQGGAIDTVIDGVTGIFFDKQSEESLNDAIRRFGKIKFNTEDLLKNAQKFKKEKFIKDVFAYIKSIKG